MKGNSKFSISPLAPAKGIGAGSPDVSAGGRVGSLCQHRIGTVILCRKWIFIYRDVQML